MKKIAKLAAATFASSLLVLSMLPFAASAESVTSGDYSYEVQGGEVVIVSYDGEDEEIVIPSSLDGKKVTQIGEKAFYGNGDLTSVEVPDGVTKIADHAFAIDKQIETVTLPASLKEIGEEAFQQCDSLTTLNFSGDETTWNAINIAAGNESLTNNKPNYNVALTKQEDTSSETTSSETTSSETTSSETTSSETTSSETTSSETTSSETTSSETTSSETTSSEASSSEASSSAAATTGTDSSEAAPQSSGVNIAYVIGGILVGIAVLDIIYFSINKPKPDETI